MIRLVTGRAGTIRITIYDEDGVAVDPLAAPSVTVRDGAGTSVSTGTATNADGTGVYTYTIPASVTADLDSYEATWTYTLGGSAVTSVTKFEVCGGHLFEIADLRAEDPTLADDVEFPAEKIRQKRIDAEERFERLARLAFARRAARVRLLGESRPRLILPHSEVREIYALWVDDDVMDLNDPALYVHSEMGVIEHPSWFYAGAVVDVYYEHGLEETPEPVSRAVRTLAIDYLVPSGLPARATSQSTDLGEFRVSVASRDGMTGIPEVDSVLADFGRRTPSIG